MTLSPGEKLGASYLGRRFDADQGRVTDQSYLYDSIEQIGSGGI